MFKRWHLDCSAGCQPAASSVYPDPFDVKAACRCLESCSSRCRRRRRRSLGLCSRQCRAGRGVDAGATSSSRRCTAARTAGGRLRNERVDSTERIEFSAYSRCSGAQRCAVLLPSVRWLLHTAPAPTTPSPAPAAQLQPSFGTTHPCQHSG